MLVGNQKLSNTCTKNSVFNVLFVSLLQVRVWNIPDDGLSENGIEAVSTIKGFTSRPEVLQHHSVAENVLAISCGSELQVWNLSTEKSISSKVLCGNLTLSVKSKCGLNSQNCLGVRHVGGKTTEEFSG